MGLMSLIRRAHNGEPTPHFKKSSKTKAGTVQARQGGDLKAEGRTVLVILGPVSGQPQWCGLLPGFRSCNPSIIPDIEGLISLAISDRNNNTVLTPNFKAFLIHGPSPTLQPHHLPFSKFHVLAK